MKTIARMLLIALLVSTGIRVFAQFTVVIFSPKGEKFTAYINGNEQNSEPSYRVEADNPGGPTFKIRIVFPDPSNKEINKTVFNKPGSTVYYKIDRNARGAFIIEPASSEWFDPGVTNKEEKPEKVEEEKPAEKAPGKTGCSNPMSEPDFAASLVAVSSAPFEPMKLSNAKKIAEKHCLTAQQVVLTMAVFDSESSRLSFAKFAYDHTYNQSDYEDVRDALHSQKSKDDLDRFLSTRK